MLSSFHSFLGCELPRKHHIIWKKFGSLFAAWVAYQHSLEVHAMCTMHAFHVASAMRFLDCRCWEVEINHSGALFSQKPLRQRSHVVICHIVSILIELQKKKKSAWLDDWHILPWCSCVLWFWLVCSCIFDIPMLHVPRHKLKGIQRHCSVSLTKSRALDFEILAKC